MGFFFLDVMYVGTRDELLQCRDGLLQCCAKPGPCQEGYRKGKSTMSSEEPDSI